MRGLHFGNKINNMNEYDSNKMKQEFELNEEKIKLNETMQKYEKNNKFSNLESLYYDNYQDYEDDCKRSN